MLALTAALIVSAYDRTWLSAPVGTLAGPEGPGLQRLSRLKRRVLEGMEALVAQATRRGRPPSSPTEGERVEVLQALLVVAASLIQEVPLHRRDLQDRLVQAFVRLKQSHAVKVRTFCQLLGIKERTFRSWRARPPAPLRDETPPPTPAKKKKRKGWPTGLFDLIHRIPGIQVMGDTTDLKVLGVPLKLIGLQDPGRRLSRLFEGFGIYSRERSREVVDLVTRVLSDQPGTQFITDQGTPYLAELARETYESLELVHAPQKEGTPTAKATLERAFGVVKESLRPLLALTNRLADQCPALKDADLAQSLGQLLVAVLLRVYILAARDASHPLADAPAREIEIVAHQQRESARQEERSKRLCLEEIHDAYAMEGSRERFVRTHRNHALEDIQEAERALRTRACRCRTRVCDRYFAGILRNVAERERARRARSRREELEKSREKKQEQEQREHRQTLYENPDRLFIRGLDLLSHQWMPGLNQLLAGGAGPGRVMVRDAVALLAEKNPWTFHDDVQALCRSWGETHPDMVPTGFSVIENLVYSIIKEHLRKIGSTTDCINDIVRGASSRNQHSPPGTGLADLSGKKLE